MYKNIGHKKYKEGTLGYEIAGEADEATDAELLDAEVWEVEGAINKVELINLLDRYIYKPIKKQ